MSAARFGSAYRPAPAAQYDATAKNRRGMIARIKMAQKTIGLTEDDYRAMLMRVTGEASAADCSETQLRAMVAALGQAGAKPARPAVADHPSARKARAIWISLHQLGVVRNPSEEALEAFAARQLRVDKLQWANQSQSYKLIEALKAMAEKAGWSQSTEGVPSSQVVKVLRLRLCDCLLDRLKTADLVPAEWRLRQAAWSLCGLDDERGVGPTLWSAEQLAVLARGLADKLRNPLRPISAEETLR